MRVIYKSLLDLIPLTLVAIAISYIAGYTLREISTSYRQIISEDVSVISELRIANNALDSWKALVSEGISSANDTSDGGYTFFEKTEEEEKLFAEAISNAMIIYAPNETSNENPESSEIDPEEEIVPSETETEKLRQEFLKMYIDNPCEKSKLFNGLDEVLTNLNEQGLTWGIVTNKPHAMTKPLLKKLGLLSRAGCVVSGDRLPQRKPHPAPVLLGANELGIPRAYCVYVGDAPRDIEAGRAAGMPTIATSYGYIRGCDNPETWGASIVIKKPTEIINALKSLNENYTFNE